MREMKDSGIEWIGTIPFDWKCCKQKYEIQLINGRAYNDSEFEEDGKYTPVVRGYTNLEKIKPKEMWEWGDIYGEQVMNCIFDQNTEKLIALWEQEDDINEI